MKWDDKQSKNCTTKKYPAEIEARVGKKSVNKSNIKKVLKKTKQKKKRRNDDNANSCGGMNLYCILHKIVSMFVYARQNQ